MSEVSMTLTGAPQKVQRVIDYWISLGGIPRVEEYQAPKLREVRGCLEGLTSDGRRPVGEISSHSAVGQRTSQDELWQELGFPSEQYLDGVLGGVGNQWKRVMTQPNPFTRKWDGDSKRGYYEIGRELAQQLIRHMSEG